MSLKLKHKYFTKNKVIVGVSLIFFGVMVYLFINFNDIYFNYSPKKATFSKLEKIRQSKKVKVTRYLDKQKDMGERASHNDEINGYFKKLHYLYKNNAYNSMEYALIEQSINQFYVTQLDKFYDILFIDNEGEIFFTVKKEGDFLGNIYEDRFNGVSLYERMRKIKIEKTEFVDYEYYSVSDEAASFFISPVLEKNKVLGHIALQLPINDINSILTDRQNLGRTGEVYLVNFKQLMITQSRFIDDSTILTKQIDTEAVRNALEAKSGNTLIEDYRGKRVFSSYEQFDYEGVTWIIIAEIDEDEVITEVYCAKEKDLFSKACKYLQNYTFSKDKQKLFVPGWKQKEDYIKVDFREFQKSKNGDILYTEGVATCTALTISYPGKFGYLIHLTPTDAAYRNIGFLTRILLRDDYTDFVGTVMKGINRYDIIQYEKSFLRFGIIATHNSSFENIIHKLIENGVELSQIKVLFKNEFQKVDIVFDYRYDQVWSMWGGLGYNMMFGDEYKQVPDLGEIVKKISNYNNV